MHGRGILHGGTIMALADSAGAVAAFLNLREGAGTSTTSSNTVFLRGVAGGTVTATARPLHVGRRTIAVVVELVDDDGRPVAQVTQSQAVLT
ncbi:PaaI family thioesterase [Tomitella cavernea]|uniref:Thioesterase domain-containing protein n=1 Tax=Tomitella cavernea TaxID=1387982 RepID=A0ABP9D1M6_9ACTN